MHKRTVLIFILLVLLSVIAFAMDLMLGSVAIPFDTLLDVLQGNFINKSWEFILTDFRLPKAITALFVGAGISIAGLQMQTLFHNPLADTSILGVGSGASLTVALFVLSPTLFPGLIPASVQHNYWGMILASIAGAMAVLLLISAIAAWLKDIVSLLIIGVMIGFITASIVSVMQFFSDPEVVKNYLIWTFGSLSGTTWSQLYFMIPVVSVGLLLSLLTPKSMNAILLGEGYAQSVGVNVRKVRLTLIFLTGLITGTLTAFTGPIAFVGIAVPHVARLLFKTTNHQILLPATMLCGIVLMLCCDIISQLPGTGIALPINSVTSILGAPIVIFIILKSRRGKTFF